MGGGRGTAVKGEKGERRQRSAVVLQRQAAALRSSQAQEAAA